MIRAVICECGNVSYTKSFDFNGVLGPGPMRPVWRCADCGRVTERQIRTSGEAKQSQTLLAEITGGRVKAPTRRKRKRGRK